MTLKKLRPFMFVAPALLLVAGIAAACGGDDNSNSDTKPTAAATSAASPATNDGNGAADAAAEIDQDNLTFKPGKATVKVGEKILFKNSETALHTVTIAGKNESGNMKKGETFVWTASKAGEFKVTCDYHPQMNATITVEE